MGRALHKWQWYFIKHQSLLTRLMMESCIISDARRWGSIKAAWFRWQTNAVDSKNSDWNRHTLLGKILNVFFVLWQRDDPLLESCLAHSFGSSMLLMHDSLLGKSIFHYVNTIREGELIKRHEGTQKLGLLLFSTLNRLTSNMWVDSTKWN